MAANQDPYGPRPIYAEELLDYSRKSMPLANVFTDEFMTYCVINGMLMEENRDFYVVDWKGKPCHLVSGDVIEIRTGSSESQYRKLVLCGIWDHGSDCEAELPLWNWKKGIPYPSTERF